MKKLLVSFVSLAITLSAWGQKEADVAALIKQLGTDKAMSAVRELRLCRESAVPLLIDALKSPEVKIKSASGFLLGEANDPRAVDPLIAACDDSEPGMRATAAEALAKLHDLKALDRIKRLTRDTEEMVRALSLQALGMMKDQSALPDVLLALKDKSPRVRASAASVCGQLDALSSRLQLLPLLADAEPDVRYYAMAAIPSFRDATVEAALVKAIDDTDQRVRFGAIYTLSEMGSKAGIEGTYNLATKNETDREYATTILARVGDQRAVPLLTKLLEDGKGPQRGRFLFMLASLRDPSTVRTIAKFLSDPAPEVQASAVQALGNLGSSDAVVFLKSNLDKLKDETKKAAEALIKQLEQA